MTSCMVIVISMSGVLFISVSTHVCFLLRHDAAVHTETAGHISGCRGCILCGFAGSSSHSTGLQSCCVLFTIRYRPGPLVAVFVIEIRYDFNFSLSLYRS